MGGAQEVALAEAAGPRSVLPPSVDRKRGVGGEQRGEVEGGGAGGGSSQVLAAADRRLRAGPGGQCPSGGPRHRPARRGPDLCWPTCWWGWRRLPGCGRERAPVWRPGRGYWRALEGGEERRTRTNQVGASLTRQRTAVAVCVIVCVCVSRTLGGEVEERRLLSPVGQLDIGVAQLVEEGVRAGLQWGEAGRGRVLQQAGAQGDCLWGRARSEYLRGGGDQSEGDVS